MMKFLNWLIAEIKKIWLITFFFAIAFLYILFVMKLYLKAYEIDIYGVSKAIVGALFAAKAILIVNKTPLVHHFLHLPRIIPLLYRTFLYCSVVILFGNLEGIIHSYTETGTWSDAWSTFLAHRDSNRFWATNLCIAIVFLIYNTLESIETFLGKGWLFRFFFNDPTHKPNIQFESKEVN